MRKPQFYKYSEPDLINYRKNQRRLFYVTYVLSCLPAIFFWAAMKDLDPTSPFENMEPDPIYIPDYNE